MDKKINLQDLTKINTMIYKVKYFIESKERKMKDVEDYSKKILLHYYPNSNIVIQTLFIRHFVSYNDSLMYKREFIKEMSSICKEK